MTTLRALLLCIALLAGACGAGRAQNDPLIVIHNGQHYIWYCNQSVWQAHQTDIAPYFDYADRAFAQIISDWGVPMPQRKFYLYVNPANGFAAFAAGDIAEIHQVVGHDAPGISVWADCYWTTIHGIKGYFGYTFTTHESVNNLTGNLVTANWPRDWWADDKSPFPAMTAVQVEREVGQPDVSRFHDDEFVHDPVYQMDKALLHRYGWGLWRKMFDTIQADHLDLSRLDDGNNPSAILTAYVSAYYVIGSGDTLDHLNPYFAGVVPSYNEEATREVLAARTNWKEHGGSGQAFLTGHYLSAGGYPDFKLTRLCPQGVVVAPGEHVIATFKISRIKGYSGAVSLAGSGLPRGVSAKFRRESGGKIVAVLTANSTAPAGGSTMEIRGASANLPPAGGHCMLLPVIVNAASQVPVNIAPVSTLYGIAAKGCTLGDFGGIDGHGNSYAGDAIGRSVIANDGTVFALAPASNGQPDSYNAVSARTVPLPRGHYTALELLGSANNGNKPNEPFTVLYADGTTKTFTQSLSDWTSPQYYAGETIALTMRDYAVNHGVSKAPHSVYAYRFRLDMGKAVKSVTLPADSHVVALAVTLVK